MLGRRSIFFTSLLCLRALAAASQDAIPLQPGTRVHVTSRMFSANPYTGPTLVTATFLELRNDSLFLQLDRGQSAIVANGKQPIGVPVNTVTALLVRRGKRPATVEGAWIGFAVGLAGGVVVVLHDSAGRNNFDFYTGLEVFTAGMGGALLGAGVGSLFHTDRWVPIPTDRLRVAVRPSGGLGRVRVELRVAF